MHKLLKRGNFTSVADLEAQVLAFTCYYNQTMDKLVKWAYQDKPWLFHHGRIYASMY